MATLPTVVTQDGLVPQAPVTIQQNLLTDVEAIRPGLEMRLPGLMIEDISSTDVAAIVMCDSARVEAVNSLTPKGANAWLLLQIGAMLGIYPGEETNTSVQVVFNSNPGWVIPIGFTVSDGVYSYVVQDGGVVGTSGQSAPLYCVASLPGSWAVPAGSVTQISTSVPSTITVTCSNPYAGTPSGSAETEASYRARVLTANLASAQGMPSFIRTQINQVAGVQSEYTSIQQQVGGGWKILVVGGDPYAVAYAISIGVADISTLVGSTMSVANITSGPNAIVTTVLNHGLSTGQIAYVNGITSGMTGINSVALTVTVIDEKNFSTAVNTALFGAYTGGGVVTPNFRNNVISLLDYPDVYSVPFISAPQQQVAISVTWNTTETNFVNVAAVAQLGAPALASYVNSIPSGQPMNLFELQTTFQTAVASVLPSQLLTRMVFGVSVNGIGVAPIAGTGEILGDPESYFYASPDGSSMTILQG